MVLRVYRRQPLIQDICRRIGYQGRYVWLVGGPKMRMLASKHLGVSRIRYRILRLDKEYEIDVMGPRRNRTVSIPVNKAVVALPILRGRRRTLFMFVCPAIVEGQRFSTASTQVLMPEEYAILANHESAYDAVTMDVARAICIHRELFTTHNKLTSSGLELLGWHESKGGKSPC
jgi:hypothetical protein